jgi:hypothetical protein
MAVDVICDTTEDCPENQLCMVVQRHLFTYDFGKFLPFQNIDSEAAKETTKCLMMLQRNPDITAVSVRGSIASYLTDRTPQLRGNPSGSPSTLSLSYVDMFAFPYCTQGSSQPRPKSVQQPITWESKRRGIGKWFILRGLKEVGNDGRLVQGQELSMLNDDGTETP